MERKAEKVSERHQTRNFDFHVSISQLKPFCKLMYGPHEAKLYVENAADTGDVTV